MVSFSPKEKERSSRNAKRSVALLQLQISFALARRSVEEI